MSIPLHNTSQNELRASTAEEIADKLIADLKTNGLNGVYFDTLKVVHLNYADYADEMTPEEFFHWRDNYANFIADPDLYSEFVQTNLNDYCDVEIDFDKFYQDLKDKVRTYFDGNWTIKHYKTTGEFEVYK